MQSGQREHERVDLALGELAQPGVDVAPQRHHLEVGRSARSWAARRTLLVPIRAPGARADQPGGAAERVARVGAGGNGHQLEALVELGGDILGRVHGDVDAPVEQRALELGHPARLVLEHRPAVARGW